jgi:glyoxylase-like metal-dependent hydrolase (beta-lactamase superfamily II)
MPTTQAPHYYRFMLGNAPATVVSDGILPLGSAVALFPGVVEETIRQEMDEAFLSVDNVQAEQNALVIELNGRTILFDTGMGTLKAYGGAEFGDTCGALMHNLAAAGINPASIDAVIMTHGHIDHVGGVVADDGSLNFPNAQYYISRVDFEFYTDINQPHAMQRDHARKNLLPVQDRLTLLEDGDEVVPGIKAIWTPGHAPGHMIYMIESDGERLAFLGDLLHHHVLQHDPMRHNIFDGEPATAAESRLKAIRMLANEQVLCSVFHFAWPGLGYFRANGNDSFRFIPQTMRMLDRVDRADPVLIWPTGGGH